MKKKKILRTKNAGNLKKNIFQRTVENLSHPLLSKMDIDGFDAVVHEKMLSKHISEAQADKEVRDELYEIYHHAAHEIMIELKERIKQEKQGKQQTN